MSLTIAGVADLVPGTKYSPLPDSPFFQPMRDAAVTIANLEVPLTEKPSPKHGGIVLHSPTAFAREMKKIGVGVGSIANNHILGHGHEVVYETIAACQEAGVATVGYGNDRADASRPLYLDVKDRDGRTYKIAVVAATSVGPPEDFATDSEAGVSALRVETRREDDPRSRANPGVIGKAITEPVEDDLRLLEEQVRAAKAQTPVVAVVLHWGLGDAVLDYMRIAAQRLVDAGASLVFGHHTHHFAAVDWYKQAPIFYGLGNFLFQYDGDTPVHVPHDAATALVDIDPVTGVATGARMVIGRIDDAGVPWPASSERVEHVVEELARLSAGRNVELKVTPEGCEVSPRDLD
jgi:poly-gamma-glutamate synthesis protein (capsule biosynthesis protein)